MKARYYVGFGAVGLIILSGVLFYFAFNFWELDNSSILLGDGVSNISFEGDVLKLAITEGNSSEDGFVVFSYNGSRIFKEVRGDSLVEVNLSELGIFEFGLIEKIDFYIGDEALVREMVFGDLNNSEIKFENLSNSTVSFEGSSSGGGSSSSSSSSSSGGDGHNKDKYINNDLDNQTKNYFDGWRALIVRSQEDYEKGNLPGEGMQCPHSIVRSHSNPNYIYFAHDCGQGWRSMDGGDTWERMLSKGLGTIYAQSIEVDPLNPDVIFLTVDNTWKTSDSYYQGLYKSIDRGDNWDFVLPVDYNEDNTLPKHNIAYSLSSITNNNALIWYSAFAGNGLYKSIDGGNNWDYVSGLDEHTKIYNIYVHPKDNNVLYLGSNKGLYRSTDGGITLANLGNLPSGEVTSIQINDKNPDEIYVVVKNKGLYNSIDGGLNFELLKSGNQAIGCSINQGYPEVIYFYDKEKLLVSLDKGINWEELNYHPREGLGRDTGWGSKMDYSSGAIIPNPEKRCEAVGFGQCNLWKTNNCTDFSHSNNLFSGYYWTCKDGMMFDSSDPNRVAHFGADLGLLISNNGGIYYELLETPYSILLGDYGYSGNSNDMKAGAFQPESSLIIGSGGRIWGRGQMGIVSSKGDKGPWETTNAPLSRSYRYYFYNQNNPDELFVSNTKSSDGGKTYTDIDFLVENNLEIYGMCKSNSSILYALGSGTTIYRSDNAGEDWYEYAYSGVTMGDEIVFDVDPFDCNKIYTLYDGEDRDLSSFDGIDWHQFNLSDYIRSLPENSKLISLYPDEFAWQRAYPNIASVIIDPNNNNIIYATVSHAGVAPVYRSLDGGDTWEDISYNLPRAGYGSAFSINPNSGEIFVSSCSGTWVFPPPYNNQTSLYVNSISRPSCSDGLMNGDETSIDEGPSCRDSFESLDKNTFYVSVTGA